MHTLETQKTDINYRNKWQDKMVGRQYICNKKRGLQLSIRHTSRKQETKQEARKLFYQLGAKQLYLSKCTGHDIQTAVVFLCTRVNMQDIGKSNAIHKRHDNIIMPKNNPKSWINSSYVVNLDMIYDNM